MRALLVVLALVSGCATSDRMALVASTAAIVCDMAQTAQGASEGWRYSTERNPMLRDAGVGRVLAYGAAVTVLHVAVWAVLPRGVRSVYASAVGGASWAGVSDSVPRRHVCFGEVQP